MMGLKYWGEFAAKGGHVIRTELFVKGYTGPQTEVRFPGESPIVIEWPEVDKLEPIQGSNCTLKLVSETDRQFLDLHEADDGDVRLDIYRDGALYWSGTLDPEAYEEPYSEGMDYDVSLSFYDFGILGRLSWCLTGMSEYKRVIEECIRMAGINYSDMVERISTCSSSGRAFSNLDIYVDNANFYDEDDVAMTAKEVLSGLLQPFAIRLIQRSGSLYLYDLNSLYDEEAGSVYWTSTDAVLSYDATYKKATVTFSPYASTDIIDGAVKVASRSGNGTTIYTDYDSSGESREGFVIRSGNDIQIEDNVEIGHGVPFEIKAAYSGSDCSGFIALARTARNSSADDISYSYIGQDGIYVHDYDTRPGINSRLMFTATSKLRCVPTPLASQKYRLRINLDLLLDVRYNPFEDAGKYNERGNYKKQQSDFCRAYIPVMINLLDDNGNVTYHLENDDVYRGLTKEAEWKSGPGEVGCFLLTYYEGTDLKKSVLSGWTSNRKCVSAPYPYSIPELWGRLPAGEYAPLPPSSGRIQMSVYSGAKVYRANGGVFDNYLLDGDDLKLIRWMAYKDAAISITDFAGKDIKLEDQVDSTSISGTSHEEYSVDTIIGTLDSSINSVMSRGVLRSYTGSAYESFTRAGITARLERLLLGTIYSQYAQRCQVLSGTVRLLDGPMAPLTDDNSTGKYIMMSDSQDLLENESRMSMAEFYTDNYEEEQL